LPVTALARALAARADRRRCAPVREDGKVVRAKAASTVAEAQARADDLRAELARRQVHPDVLALCRLPKKSALTSYSYRLSHDHQQ